MPGAEAECELELDACVGEGAVWQTRGLTEVIPCSWTETSPPDMHIYLHTHANCVLVPLMYTSSHQSQVDANDFKLSIQLAIRGSLPLSLACHCSCTYGMWSLCSVEALYD